MRCGSHFKISVIGPEKGCKSLQSRLTGSAFQIRVWPLPQVFALLADVEDNPGQIVVLIMTDDQPSLIACRLLIRRLSSARLLLIYDYPDGPSGSSDCLLAPPALPASMTSLLDCLGDESLTNIADAPVTGGETIGQGQVSQTPLSAREIEILSCLAHGHANKRIARELNITEATVKVHVKAILRKLHLTNRTQAAIWAVQNGFTWKPDASSTAREPSPVEEQASSMGQRPLILPIEFHRNS